MRSLLTVLSVILLLPWPLRADLFDRYTNVILKNAPGQNGVQEVPRLTPDQMADNDRVLPGLAGAVIVVRTNEDRYAKLLVEPIRQKISPTKIVSALLIDRYVTYREGEEQAIDAQGRRLQLFNGFRLNLDIGQVVPAELGGDLRFVSTGGKTYLEPLGKAKLYLLTRPLPGTQAPNAGRFEMGTTFEPRYFNGTYHLHADGRRSGKLVLQVNKRNEVFGAFYSDKDGRKYEVNGTLGSAAYLIRFTIRFPRTEEDFHGHLFSGDGAAIAGTSKLNEREAGFYAIRSSE